MNTRKKLKTIGLSLAGLTLSLTAAVAAPIGVNWVNNSNGNTQNGSADSMVATDIAGAPGLEQGNWNNLGRWGNSINLVDGNGVATGVLINWDATGVWNNGASTSDPNGKMMNGYLDSNGSANTALGGPRVYDAGNNNKPVIYVDSGLRAWMTAQGATSYDVVIYIDGDTSDGSRRPQYWLQNCTGPYSAWVPGSDLSTHVALRDAANFGSTFTYTQVPLTSTTGANASSGNYAIFTGLTNDSFLLRTEDSPYARSPINGLQIVPRMTAGDPPALIAPNSVTNYAGATNVFTAAVGGILPMTYQWMAGPIGSSTYTNVLDGNNIAGATTPTLTITNLQFANEADYVLVATGPYGTTTTTPASLKVVAALVTQPLFPASARLYPGGTARFSIQATGTQPLTYQWRKNGSAIAGATTNSLVLGPVSNADAANYDVVITTPYGSVSQSASLSLLAAPTANSFAATVLAKAPLAYWRLGEEWGATTAYDNWGSFNGTYGVASSLQQTGPTDPDFTGFENPNYSLGVTATANAWATVPALNLSTNAVTFVAWLYPDGSAGSQQPWAGIFMTRAGGTQAGFGFRGSANELGLTWNTNTTWQYSSGLSVPNDQWSMAALVIEPTKATIYLGNTNVGLISKSISLPLGSEAWAGVANIGNDPNDATANRAFKGSMDEVAVFKYSLSPADMLSLYAAGRARGVLPPVIAKNPASLTLYPGCTAQFTVEATGSGTLTYQWKKVMGGVTNSVANGGNISGATTATLTLSSVGTADVGDYFVVVANSAGFATSTAASLALATPTGKPYETAVIAAAPYAYWRLNEASGVTAFDNFGGHNGMYGSSATLGYAGPMTSDFSGFENNNTALATGNAMVESWVTAEDLNLNTNTVTITAWINPIGAQAAWSGLVFNRAGLTRAGLGFDAGGTNLVYNWNDNGLTYNFNSGLTVPPFQWSFVALVVEPTQATLYLYNSTGQVSAVNVVAHPNQVFGGTTYLGNDPYDTKGARIFNGTLDEVAIWNRALTGEQIAALYSAASGALVRPEIGLQPLSQTVYAGTTAQLTVGAAGSAALSYQWQKNGAPVSGATTAVLTLPNVTSADAGNYTVVVANAAGSVTSQAAKLTVLDAATAELINVDINNGASATFTGAAVLGGIGDFWNGISGTAGFGPVALKDATGLATPVTLSLAKADGSGYTMSGNSLLADYSYATNQTITLSNLQPNATYYLVVYSIGGGGTTGFEGGVFSGGLSGTSYGAPLGAVPTAAFVEGTNYLRNTTAVSDAAGTLSFNIRPVSTITTNANGSCDFNGLQIQHVPLAGLRPAIAQEPVSRQVYVGGSAQFSVVATPLKSGLTYQWYKGGNPVAGATTSTLTLAGVTASDAGNYSVIVANASGTVTSQTATLSLVTPAAGSYEAAVITYTPMAYWRMNEASGSAVLRDYVGGFDATNTDVTLGVIGPVASGLGAGNTAAWYNNANTNSASTTSASLLNNLAQFSIVGWFNLDAAPDARDGLFGQNDCVEFGFHNATSIGIWTPNGGYLEFPIASVGYNQWHQVAAVADGNGYALYLDGVLQATGGNAITTGSYGSSASPFRIGGGGILDASANTMNGAIDEVAVFNYALSAGQVQNLYQAVPNVVLKIQPVGTQLQLSWPQGTLLEADDLTGPWTTNSATSPCLVPTSAAKKFYRVIVK